MWCCGAAVLRCCGAALLRCCGAALLRCCVAALLRCCVAAVLRCCGAAVLRCREGRTPPRTAVPKVHECYFNSKFASCDKNDCLNICISWHILLKFRFEMIFSKPKTKWYAANVNKTCSIILLGLVKCITIVGKMIA